MSVSNRLEVMGSVAEGYAFPTGRIFWSLSFAYACFMALLLQKAILPLWPEMHAGHGLLMNDAIVFHNMAVGRFRLQVLLASLLGGAKTFPVPHAHLGQFRDWRTRVSKYRNGRRTRVLGFAVRASSHSGTYGAWAKNRVL